MNIMKWNKIIAEFMGYKLMPCNNGKAWDIGKSIPSKDHLLPIQGVLHTGNELKFYTSWDWLMPVVEKIEMISKYDIQSIYDERSEFMGWYPDIFSMYPKDNICDFLSDLRFKTKLEATYKAVVEFIKWYNQNKEN